MRKPHVGENRRQEVVELIYRFFISNGGPKAFLWGDIARFFKDSCEKGECFVDDTGLPIGRLPNEIYLYQLISRGIIEISWENDGWLVVPDRHWK